MKLQWEDSFDVQRGFLPSEPDVPLAFVNQEEDSWVVLSSFASNDVEEIQHASEAEAKAAAEGLMLEWVYKHTLGWRPSLGVAPLIVCLCGSTRFFDAFRAANLKLTLEGKIVLSIGCDFKSDEALIAEGKLGEGAKQRLDELHKRKIDLCDEILVLNVGGYIGESTRSEIEYARMHGKPVNYLEDQGGASL